MARLDFDFHASPRRPGMAAIGLLLLGVAAIVWAGWSWQQARATVAGQALRIAAFTQARPAAPDRSVTRTAQAALGTRTGIIAQLRYSWQPAFGALAGALDGKVALVSLEASRAKGELKLLAEARRLADAVAFIDRLQRQPAVKRAVLLQHELQADDPQRPIRFNVRIELQPQGGAS